MENKIYYFRTTGWTKCCLDTS